MDRRILRTRKLLTEALQSLMLEKAYDVITIKDITTRADIGRSTFYTHFENKEQLLFSGHDSFMQDMGQHHQSTSEFDSLKLFGLLFTHMQENKQLAQTMTAKGSSNIMLDRMTDILVQHFKAQAERKVIDEKKIALFAEVFSAAIIRLSIHSLTYEKEWNIKYLVDKSHQILQAFIQLSR